jgi:hypothetical protein
MAGRRVLAGIVLVCGVLCASAGAAARTPVYTRAAAVVPRPAF